MNFSSTSLPTRFRVMGGSSKRSSDAKSHA
jgi:hypothetical protein